MSGRPIKFVGTGEKMHELEQFYPARMADRILGKGDILTLGMFTLDVLEVLDNDDVNTNYTNTTIIIVIVTTISSKTIWRIIVFDSDNLFLIILSIVITYYYYN